MSKEGYTNLQPLFEALDRTSAKPASCIVCNPPYGKRLNTSPVFYRDLTKFAKRYNNARLFFLTSDERMLKTSLLPLREKISCFNGGLPVKLYSHQNR